MRNFFRFEPLYVRLAIFLLAVTVYFIPSHGELNGFGFPIAFFTFPSGYIRNSLFDSTYINILYLLLDFILLYIIVKILGEIIRKIILFIKQL